MAIQKTLFGRFVACCLLAVLAIHSPLALAQEAQKVETTPLEPIRSEGDYVIGPGDIIEVRVFRQPEMGGKYRVSENGQINLLFVGQVQAAGKTEMELTEDIRRAYLKILKNPQVGVILVESASRLITVVGAVKNPGRYALRRDERLLDVIAMAGGLMPNASDNVNLVRYSQLPVSNTPEQIEAGEAVISRDNLTFETINLRSILTNRPDFNRAIQPGDLINVPEADVIYISGSVSKPGSFSLKEPLTLTQAVALAGGLAPEAKKSDIRIYRAIPGEPERKELICNYSDIEKGKAKDMPLQASDVVYVNSSQAKSLGIGFVKALTVGLAGGLALSVINRR